MTDTTLTGRTATELAALVKAGHVSAHEVTQQHLAHLAEGGDRFGAFERLRAADALHAADRVDRADAARRIAMPLAGVPIAVKDNVRVAGIPMRQGSRATDASPSRESHPLVARLEAAGAVILGTTRVPELCLWGTSDNAFGVARSPWAPDRTAGGSSGGSAAAVASALVPVAHGNDGLGSIRIPAACCGLVGIKPGHGVVPSALGANSWYDIAENGVLATTVADAALVLSVLADDAALATVEEPREPLRIALAITPPAIGLRVHPEVADRTRAVGDALRALGHFVEPVRPPMPSPLAALAILGTWTAGAAGEVEALFGDDPAALGLLEPRTRAHATAGRIARRLGLAAERHRTSWRAAMDRFLSRYDVLLTPTLAAPPLAADDWRHRGWLANVVANLTVAPYCGPVNFARLPAIAVPAGVHSDGTPASAHMVASAGREPLLLGLAASIERTRPWTRFSPRISHRHAVTPNTRA